MNNPILEINDLAVSFQRTEQRQRVVTDVVRGLNLQLHAGETVALVGESGSGKTLTALSILQLLPYPHAFHRQGSIIYQEEGRAEEQVEELVGASPASV